jgi:exosome complex component RRP42
MAPAGAAAQLLLLSPAELSYLHSSLGQTPPVRPDGRGPAQFRPLVAETDILPATNGSARVCFADGTEAVVGVKAEVEKSAVSNSSLQRNEDEKMETEAEEVDGHDGAASKGSNSWVEMSIDVPGYRDDDVLPVFLAAMLTEGLLASGGLKDRLYINRRFHWKLYIDVRTLEYVDRMKLIIQVILLSPPLSYPLPLLSITTHLALLSSRLPKLVSEGDEDPLFNDDWEASTYLYPFDSSRKRKYTPPITLLVIAVGSNIVFDPNKEELAVAEGVLALTVGSTPATDTSNKYQILSLRSIDPPSRLTPAGIPNDINAVAELGNISQEDAIVAREKADEVWNPPRGGLKRPLIAKIVKQVLESGGVAEEVMDGLNGVEI